jgi:predicted TIM-barrel fold metal-dependent hydrolase
MIIDAHNHPDWRGYNLEKCLADMDANGIDIAWLLSWETPVDEVDPTKNATTPGTLEGGPVPFARCLSYVERAPGRFLPGFCPDPRRPDAVDRLKAMKDTYGVRICGEMKLRMMYDNWDAIRLFRFCGREGLPVTVHLDYEFDTGASYPRPNWWYGGGIEAFERAVRACPDTAFLGHAPGFWSHISGDDRFDKESYPAGPVLPGGKVPALMRQYPNLYCEISARSGWNALNRDHAFTREFLHEFQDRVLYARDSFDTCHRELLDSLGLDAGVLAKIYAGNAMRLVPLDGGGS